MFCQLLGRYSELQNCPTKNKLLKSFLKDFWTTTSIVGLVNAAGAGTFVRKILWIIIFTAGLVG